MLSWIYWAERAHGFNVRPDPLGRSLAAARRAIDCSAFQPFCPSGLAFTFFQKDFLAFSSRAAGGQAESDGGLCPCLDGHFDCLRRRLGSGMRNAESPRGSIPIIPAGIGFRLLTTLIVRAIIEALSALPSKSTSQAISLHTSSRRQHMVSLA